MVQHIRSFIREHRRLVLLQAPFAVLAIVVFFWRVDVGAAIARLGSADYRWALLGLGAFTISKAVHAWRWRFFLRHHPHLPYVPLFSLFLVSNLANALVPLRAGDLIRVEIPSRRFNVPRAELATSVFVVESVLDGVAFVLLLTAAVIVFDAPLLGSLLTVFALGVLGLFTLLLVLARLRVEQDLSEVAPIDWLPERWRVPAARILRQLLDGLTSLGSNREAAAAVAVSLLAWLLEVGVYWAMGQAFNFDLGLHEALIVMIAANLIVSLPITPWDVGPYEIAVTEALVLIGASRATASSYAIGSHLLLLLWIGITGIVAMWFMNLRLGDLVPGQGGSDERAQPEAPRGG